MGGVGTTTRTTFTCLLNCKDKPYSTPPWVFLPPTSCFACHLKFIFILVFSLLAFFILFFYFFPGCFFISVRFCHFLFLSHFYYFCHKLPVGVCVPVSVWVCRRIYLCEWRLLYIFFIVPPCHQKSPHLPAPTLHPKLTEVKYVLISFLSWHFHYSYVAIFPLRLCASVCVCVCMGIYVLYAHEWVCVCVLVSFLRFWSSQLHVVESRAKFSIFFFFCAKVCRPFCVCVCVCVGFSWKTHPSPSIMSLVVCEYVCVCVCGRSLMPLPTCRPLCHHPSRPTNVLRRLLQAAVIAGANMFAFHLSIPRVRPLRHNPQLSRAPAHFHIFSSISMQA